MYELIILSVLIQRPAHGYLIAKVVNNIQGPFLKVKNGRLYPLLAKLQQDGVIIAIPTIEREGGRTVNSFEITEKGRKLFHQLMLDTTSNLGEYQKFFWLKAPVLGLLTQAERLHLIAHYANYCQANVLHLTSKLEDYQQPFAEGFGPPNLAAAINSIEHRINHWQLELDWAQSLRQKPDSDLPLT